MVSLFLVILVIFGNLRMGKLIDVVFCVQGPARIHQDVRQGPRPCEIRRTGGGDDTCHR